MSPLLLRSALLLWLLLLGTMASAGAQSPPVASSLTEADIMAMLRDYIDIDKLTPA